MPNNLDYVTFRLEQNNTFTDNMFIVVSEYMATGEGVTIGICIDQLYTSVQPAPEVGSDGSMEALSNFCVKFDEYSKVRDLLEEQNREELYTRLQNIVIKTFDKSSYFVQYPALIMNLTYFMNPPEQSKDDRFVEYIKSYVPSKMLTLLEQGGFGALSYHSLFHVNYS